MSHISYFNIQKAQPDVLFAPYSGQTSMSEAAIKATDEIHRDSNQEQNQVKEGFDYDDFINKFNAAKTDPKYDMSYNLINYPQGHPLYVPQTIADTYSSDAKSMLDMEEVVMGLALLGGVSVLVIGLLISNRIVSPSVPPSSLSS